jgi:hypothetical protein
VSPSALPTAPTDAVGEEIQVEGGNRQLRGHKAGSVNVLSEIGGGDLLKSDHFPAGVVGGRSLT